MSKFIYGDKVIIKTDEIRMVREVKGVFTMERENPQTGELEPVTTYKVTSRDIDPVARDVIHGFMTVEEHELEAYEEVKENKVND